MEMPNKGYNITLNRASSADKRESTRLKGLILAGGFATRLRPLSCCKPKLLFPLVGVPLVDRMAAWFARGGVTEVILAVNHLWDKMRVEVSRRKLDAKAVLSVEESHLVRARP